MKETKSTDNYTKMTETEIVPLLVRLSIPAVLSMFITNVYNLADTAFVGRLGTSASGAVGVVFGYMAILQAIGFMFGQGSGSIISRLLGAKEDRRASEVASTAFFAAFMCAALIGVISFIFLDPLVRVLGATETIAPYAKVYTGYIILAAPFFSTSLLLNNILRYEGKAALGTVGMMTGGILNMIGDPILMFGCGLGIHGAGLSTALSQLVSFCILLSMFVRGKTVSRISPRCFRPDPAIIGDVVTTGFPSLLRQMLNSLTTILLNAESAVYGDQAVAAMSIVSRVVFFGFSIAIGIGQGLQPVSAFNYGAKRYDRVRKVYKTALLLAQIVIVVVVAVLLALSGGIIRVFRDDPAVIEIGTRALRLQAASLLFLPFSMVTEMLYQSTGHKKGATILSSMRSGALFIPLLLILANVHGLAGIQEAQPAAYVLSVVPAAIFLRHFMREMPE
ncbi:MAG: MATE family efflux transporter [Eubacteriales bacterium]|nr:MATE family efflux transporter [Eubacteriales bacterium]